ncbi:MAG: InlB B-repeat-containing protein, partial [Clostridia bacterium]|nr:InlB B-repeat-containing protein [Clostridia bacterium]
MKLKKLITIVVMLMLSVTVALSATACFGGGDDGATYTVTFDANGGSMPNDVTTMQVTVGKNYTLPTPTKTGFTFDAWESTSGVVAVSGTWKTESDVSLKAKWVAKTTAVTLDVAGGAGASSTNLTATYGQVLALPTLTKVGYNFAGWTLNGQAYDATSAWAVEDATATLVATWAAKTTAVTLNVDGGVGATETELTATYGQVLTLPTLTKAGFDFAGWTLNGQAYDATSAWAVEDATATLVATWEAKASSTTVVTLDVQGGVGATETTLTATYGETLTLPTLTKVGYNFAGWTLNGQAYDATSAWALEDATATLVATWTIKTTAVTLDVQGGVGATETTLTATYGQVLTLPTLTKAGFDFAGWTLNGQAYDVASAWAVEDATATLVATWEANAASTTVVTLNVDGGVGATETELTATYGQVLELPTLTKVGYNFAGWTLNGQAYDVASAWAVEDATATLVATWTAKTTNITLELDGGEYTGDLTFVATYGQAFTLAKPTKDGYAFAGWTLNGQAYDATSAWALEDASATLVATWEVKGTTVTLELDGGEYAGDTELNAIVGQVLQLTNPTKTGYNFTGWTLNGQAYDATSAWTLEVETATLFANWEVKTTLVTLDVDGGEYTGDLTFVATYGQAFTLAKPTKVGYAFAGWTLNGQAYDVASAWAIEDAAATLVANWTAKTTNITLELDGGEYTGDLTFVATYGQAFTLAKPTKV